MLLLVTTLILQIIKNVRNKKSLLPNFVSADKIDAAKNYLVKKLSLGTELVSSSTLNNLEINHVCINIIEPNHHFNAGSTLL